ncbi:MAG: hypothetical protein HYY18_07965 [Planctomycetes bacterium]|nr:hypothetical protein [Planctomycetota bacterium]
MNPPDAGGLLARIEREAGVPGLAAILAERLAPTDLQSLLLEVYRRRARATAPAELLARYAQNRFVRPAKSDPRETARFDLKAFAQLPPGYEAIELSPVAPLGTHSVVATVDQNKVVATSRNTEVVADSTNVQALESALRRRKNRAAEVKLAASHRLLRAQKFDSPGALPHFRLLTLTAAGRDEGSHRFEMRALRGQFGYFARLLETFSDTPARFRITDLSGGRLTPIVEKEIFATLGPLHPGADFGFDPDRKSGRGFYQTLCFKIHLIPREGPPVEVGDGGFNDWTASLLGDRKERLLCGCMAGERVMSVAGM